MGHGLGRPVKTRGRPHGHGERRSSSSSSTPHLMGSGPGRPVKTHGPPHGPGGAAHREPTSHGPRPGPAHQNFRGWAAARPSPSHFQISRPGPARPINFSKVSARPGPSHFQKSRPGPARPRQTAHDKPCFLPSERDRHFLSPVFYTAAPKYVCIGRQAGAGHVSPAGL